MNRSTIAFSFLLSVLSSCSNSTQATAVSTINVFVEGEKITITKNQPYRIQLAGTPYKNIHIRSGAGGRDYFPSRGLIPDGGIVEVTGEAINNGGTLWIPILIRSTNTSGYMAARYLTKLKSTQHINRIKS